MSPKTLKIDVNPEILVWARESIGLSREDAARRVGGDLERVEDWESGKKRPTISVLRDMAKYYKRPLGVFFLPEPPEEPSLPTDFRILPGWETKTLSKETLIAIREARWRSKSALELSESLGYNTEVKIKTSDISDDPEEMANKAREAIGIEIKEQFSWGRVEESYLNWRNGLSKINILTFQMPIPLEEARGLSLFKDGLPVIVVSSKDAPSARIFTLIHEYAHLMLGDEGICYPSEHREIEGKTAHSRIERFCNHFAGSFLVPKECLLKDKDVATLINIKELPNEAIKKISNKYKVSKYVILRRLLVSNLISKDQYEIKTSEWERNAIAREDKKPYGPELAKRMLWKYGTFFTSLVLESRERGIITTSDALDYLSISIKHLNKLESLIKKRI